ncbi:MAG: carbon-nitrogen hydrolase family protein [Alphaproteobacteria bacterium]|nr:carbon-nitrogen hydrolase family protein [Alphaproteobacteria bacterium]
MTQPFVVACVQTNSVRDIEPNLATVSDLVLKARKAGADFILLPENATMMEPARKGILQKALPEDTHPALPHFCSLAKETGAWLLIGSLAIKLDDDQVANRSFLLDAKGGVVARYDKIHMFDVDLEDGESYQESKIYRSGSQAVLASTPWGQVGMTICYDLRFPHLYRTLARAGAAYLTVPSAFTRTTGKAHWHTLIRARAIETGAYLFAPAQCGTHAGERKTYGHSLVVDPWGEVLADGGEEVGVVLAEIDPGKVEAARRKIPSLQNERPFALAAPPETPEQ